MLQTENHVFTGLQQDTSVSRQSPEYLIDAHNIRITARESGTFLSITNEKGPQQLQLKNADGNNVAISGVILGHCVLNQYLILFVHNEGVGDSILRIDMSKDEPEVFNLFQGSDSKFLGFNVNYPIEATGDYENENIQKVYWIDGINQPRVINIKRDTSSPYTWPGSFDFVPTLKLGESVTVTKNHTGGGSFPTGVIQYAFSYYNKYGQESNIFYTTKLYRISFIDRGGSPEDNVSNSFKIEVSAVDTHFEYIRIYSIFRTSLNATPICKRVIDISLNSISGTTVTYTDTGTNGDNVDPTTLLYIGGEEITAKTIGQKDGTLFLGNLNIKRPSILSIKSKLTELFNPISTAYNSQTTGNNYVSTELTSAKGNVISTGDIPYTNTIDESGFKRGEVYRVGIQLQYKTGKWSNPMWLRDYQINPSLEYAPTLNESTGVVSLPQIKVVIKDSTTLTKMIDSGYKKARIVMAQPTYSDRIIVCQGIANSTLYSNAKRYAIGGNGAIDFNTKGSLYAQSSWLFRPNQRGGGRPTDTTAKDGAGYIPSIGAIDDTHYMDGYYDATNIPFPSPRLRSTEIGTELEEDSRFIIDTDFATIHTPELIFDTSLYSLNWKGLSIESVGKAKFSTTFGDIDIQTSTPTIGSAPGFIHKSMNTAGNAALISGLFYEDFIVDDKDETPKYNRYDKSHFPVSWPVFMWHKSGSLNNDVNRNGQSAVLLKKKISNYHSATKCTYYENRTPYSLNDMQLFQSNEVSIIKINGNTYMGNIDTSVSPKYPQSKYFAGDPWRLNNDAKLLDCKFKLKLQTPGDSNSINGVWKFETYNNIINWNNISGDGRHIGDYVPDLCESSEPVRIKYKSTPHLVCQVSSDSTIDLFNTNEVSTLPIVDVVRPYNKDTFYGGQSTDALRANQWIPVSEPTAITSSILTMKTNRGDTYYQRFECLKTYAFTPEDVNQVIDIASFLVESHLNIDGRYDRNRGQTSNLNMSPLNFNLYNPIYSQADNFFSYIILDDDYYKITTFPNQITWTKEKQPGADVDLWSNITLASIYNLDGSKGEIRSLNIWENNIYCFQDAGVSSILFNSRVQIPTSDGVPIEISNNYKVNGSRYLSDGIGCINKYAICYTPLALYFIDSISGHLQAINSSGVVDLSLQKSMSTWLSQQDTSLWKPNNYTTRVFYDKNQKDIYIVTGEEALCYNETLGQFVSYMSYSDIPVMFNVFDKFYCIKSNYLYEMFAGEYNYFFDEYQGYDFTFVANGRTPGADLSTYDKVYSNMDFRADKWSDKLDSILSSESPFDYVRVWNEYQDTGEVLLHSTPDKPSVLKKKFRVWRITIPRDAHNRRDRIRNTWCKIKLGAAPRYNNGNNGFIQFHDVAMQYFV